MVTDELLNYVKGQLSQGKTQEEINSKLLIQGWNEADIEQVFLQTQSVQQAYSQSPANTTSTIQAEEKKPKHIFDFKNLKWYEWIAMLPAFLLFVQGGAFGVLIGILGWGLSLKIIRNKIYSRNKRILLVIGVTVVYYAIYIILALLINLLVYGMFNEMEG